MADGGPLHDRRPRAVVIGAGFGGLAAAVRLAARGYAVTVVERLAMAGGRARVHRQDGFVFDAGPTIVTAPFLFEELWALAGRRLADDVSLVPLDPFYRIRFDDGSSLDCHADAAAMRAEVERFAPGEGAGWERFMAASAELCRVGFGQLGHRPFCRWTDMARVVPDLLRLGSLRSVHALVARHVRDPRLRMALSFHPLFVGGHPFRAPALYGLIADLERRWGVHFVLGGIGRLVEGLVGLIERQGGRLRLGCTVDEILVEAGGAVGVRLESGEALRADIVVSDADAAHTYGRLLRSAPRRRWTDRRLARSDYAMSLFIWYFGTRRRYDAVPHHVVMMGPRYRALLDDIFVRKTLAQDMSVYLHRPTATDPGLAPPGCDAFYALAPVPNLSGGTDWSVEAEPFRARMQTMLERSLLPGLGGRIVTSRVTTPVDFRDDFLSPHGAAFGLEPVLTQSAWFRPHNRSEELANLFLVGAGTHPGAGLPGVLSSARILDEVVPHASQFASLP